MKVFPSRLYKKSVSKLLRSGKIKITEIDDVIDVLSCGQEIPLSYRDHKLKGEYLGFRECHIRPDLLLIYKIEKKVLILILANIGSHSDLF